VRDARVGDPAYSGEWGDRIPWPRDSEETTMLKRLGALGAVVGVAALAVGSVGPATGSVSSSGDDHERVTVLSTNTEQAFVDVGEPDISLGDAFVFTSQLTRHGKTVGHTGVVCTTTSVQMEEAQCVGTAWFRRGQITVQGLLAGEPEGFELAITGGTGAFEGAGGTLVVRFISDTKERLTFHLTD
jgi:hypothetical protein